MSVRGHGFSEKSAVSVGPPATAVVGQLCPPTGPVVTQAHTSRYHREIQVSFSCGGRLAESHLSRRRTYLDPGEAVRSASGDLGDEVCHFVEHLDQVLGLTGPDHSGRG